MEIAETQSFVLQQLLEDNLCSDDSDQYAMVAYEREAIAAATNILLSSIIKSGAKLSTSTKKRVKIHMEFFGVALSMKIENFQVMKLAVSTYEEWLKDSSLFGSIERQNKYIRRILKQLTQPFAFREPKSSNVYTNDYQPMLLNILEMIRRLFSQRGSEMDLETWNIGICVSLACADAVSKFNYVGLTTPTFISTLACSAFDNALVILLSSGLTTSKLWSTFAEYSKEWSTSLDYLSVWGTHVKNIYSILNSRFFNVPVEDQKYNLWIKSSTELIPTDFMQFAYPKIIHSVNKEKLMTKSDLLLSVAETIRDLKDIADGFASNASLSHPTKLKYPSHAFLKAFGSFLVYDELPPSFDKAASVNVETLLDIVAKFDGAPADQIVSYILRVATKLHNSVVVSVMKNAPSIFGQAPSVLSAIADYVIASDSPMPEILSSSLEILKNHVPLEKLQAILKKTLATYPDSFQLIAFGSNVGLDANEYLAKAIQNDSPLLPAVVSLATLIVRNESRPSAHLLTRLLESVKRKPTETTVIACLVYICEFIDWRAAVLKKDSTLTAVVEFLQFAEDVQLEKRRRLIRTLCEYAFNRLSVHTPSPDYYTRKLCSPILEKGEYHVTVGNSILLSFLENPLSVVCRGPYGKAAWVLTEDYKGSLPQPTESDEIVPQDISLPSFNRPTFQLLGETHVKIGDVSYQELKSLDDRLREKYGEEFAKWMDWKTATFYIPLNHQPERLRPECVNFLTTIGLLDVNNKLEVRIQNDRSKVENVIKRLDQLDSPVIIPAIVKTYQPEPTDRLQQFLRELSEPLDISANSDIPPLTTTVPAVPMLRSFVAFITPSMGKDAEATKRITDMFSSSFVKIYFNETLFDMKVEAEKKEKALVLMIRPSVPGLYHVRQISAPKEVTSPFSTDLIMEASTIANFVTIVLTQMLPQISKKFTLSNIKSKKAIVQELCDKNVDTELAAVISTAFKI